MVMVMEIEMVMVMEMEVEMVMGMVTGMEMEMVSYTHKLSQRGKRSAKFKLDCKFFKMMEV